MLHVIPDAVFLHVEDNAADARLFREVLATVTGNIRVRRVSSVSSALELLSVDDPVALPFDCVVTSTGLGGGRVRDLACRLRQRYDTEILPIIGLARAPLADETAGWFDAVYRKSDSRRGLRPVVEAIVSLWFERARRFHC
jgi:CheY-like chemotaxis protein